MGTYADLLARKAQFDGTAGFEPLWLPDFLFGFQADLAEWADPAGPGGTDARLRHGQVPARAGMGAERL